MAKLSLTQLERLCRALGNKRRLLIVQLIATRGSVSVGDIAEHIKLSLPSTSRHLKVLANADLLEYEQTSTTVLYSLARERDPIFDIALKSLRQ